MDFNEIATRFSSLKAVQYASEELKKNESILNKQLFEKCLGELVSFILPSISRIMAYEYNKMLDDGRLDPSLPAKSLYEAFAKIVLSNEYSDLFDKKFYVFPKTMGMQLNSLASFQREIYENYQEDRHFLSSSFSQEYGEIHAIECSKGDLHDGKSVAFVTFYNGEQLVYKPRNEDNSSLLETVVGFLAQGTKIKDYHFIRHYSNNDHSWEQIAKFRHCNSTKEIERYYYRSGVLLSAFYFLGSFDMHYENIVCDGEYPIVIDCETITGVYAGLDYLEMSSGESYETYVLRNLEIKNRLSDFKLGVLNTAFLPYVNFGDIVYGAVLSGLFPQIGEKTVTTADKMVEENGSIHFEKVNGLIGKASSVVSLEDGTSISNERAKNNLISGFCDACKFAMENKESLMNAISLFLKLHALHFRQILRSTQVYGRFVDTGFNPELLQSEEKRNDVFMILSNNFENGKHGHQRVDHEISLLKAGEIPLYYATYESRNLFCNGAVVCEEYFPKSPKEVIEYNIQRFDKFSLDFQIEMIKKSIAMVSPPVSFGKTTVKRAPESNTVTKEYLLNNVKHIIDSISKVVFPTAFGTCTIPTLVTCNKSHLFEFDLLQPGLYDNGAIPLLFIYYGHYTKDDRLVELGKQLIKDCFAPISIPARELIDGSAKQYEKPANYSVFSGVGGSLYLTYSVFALTKDPIYLKSFLLGARYILELILEKEKFESNDYDFLYGSISSVYFISKVFLLDEKSLLSDKENSGQIKILLEKAIMKYIADFNLSFCSLVGFAHGASGLAAVFTEFYKLTREKKTLSIIESLLEKEDAMIANGEWDRSTVYTWCRGRSGVLLGRDMLKKANLPSKKIISVLNKYDEWLADPLFYEAKNFCLCHGVFGNIEIKKRILGNGFDASKELPGRLFDNFSDLEWIEGFDYEYEGFMMGNTGIAYVMLELLNAAPPILTLDLWSGDKSI